jgi:hypothetical protein
MQNNKKDKIRSRKPKEQIKNICGAGALEI